VTGRLSEAETAFLERQRVAHLATADAEGRPHVVPVCFAASATSIYVVIDQKPKRGGALALKRVRNVVANPHAALVADVYDEDWTRLGWVLASGSAGVLTSGAEHARAIAALRARYPQYRAMPLDERPVIALAIERVASWGRLS
jgi:PPOX class probable F420-dependent enzyme